jgi:hypothetical protein
MKLNLIMLALRAVALIGAAGFVAVNLRNYLISRRDLSISPGLYGIAGAAFIWAVYWLSTRKLLRGLKANAKASRPQIATHQTKASPGRADTVHRYPSGLRYLVAALGLFLVALPYLSVESGKSIALATYVGCFGIACIVFVIDIYMFAYSVTVKHDRILVKAFGKQEIIFTDVAYTEVVTTRNGHQIVVALKNGQEVRFGRMLTDFSTMLDALTAQTPHRAD